MMTIYIYISSPPQDLPISFLNSIYSIHIYIYTVYLYITIYHTHPEWWFMSVVHVDGYVIILGHSIVLHKIPAKKTLLLVIHVHTLPLN